MSDVATMNSPGTAVAVPGGDPYSSYGAKVGVQGNFLTFKNGEFLYGQDAKELPIGTKLAANMPGLRIGWRRWWDDQVTDDFTELLTDQRPIAPRNTLGDLDESLWKRDQSGRPFDPWQLTNVLELVDGEGERYIYSTGSKGGINAIGRLCKEYGKLYRQRPGQIPIIELGNDHYMHKEYGKTYVPDFKIVGWTDENALTIEDSEEALPLDPPTVPAASPGVSASKVAASAPTPKKTRF